MKKFYILCLLSILIAFLLLMGVGCEQLPIHFPEPTTPSSSPEPSTTLPEPTSEQASPTQPALPEPIPEPEIETDEPLVHGLNMQNPDQARASEIVVIKIIDDVGKPVSGARIYSTAQLGDTAKDGSLVTFFKQPGDYELSARTGIAGEPGFAEAKGIGMINIIPSTIELQAFDGIPPLMPPGQTFTGDQHYKPGMTVRFRLRNTGDTEIILNNSAPWKIQSREGEIVFEPIAAQAIVQLAPGEDKEWTWNQKDKDDRQVNEGGYIVVLKCSEGEYGLRFWIIPEGMTP